MLLWKYIKYPLWYLISRYCAKYCGPHSLGATSPLGKLATDQIITQARILVWAVESVIKYRGLKFQQFIAGGTGQSGSSEKASLSEWWASVRGGNRYILSSWKKDLESKGVQSGD